MKLPRIQLVLVIVTSSGMRNTPLNVANSIPISTIDDLKRAIKEARERKDYYYLIPGVYFK